MRLLWLLLAILLLAGAVAGARALRRTGPQPPASTTVAEPLTTGESAPIAERQADPARSPDVPASERESPSGSPAAPASAATQGALITPWSDLPPAASTANQPTAAPQPRTAQLGPITPSPANGAASTPITAIPPSVEALPDGQGLLLDGRFLVRGRGTEVDPLRVPWDLLVSAQETYDPAKQRLEIPSRISTLSGQTVSITGYLAAAPGAERTDELMVMLNKWDGCCLGLPPSPYDAVEVKLSKPVTLRGKHTIRYGTVTGRLECEPFLVGGWLVGMYRMQDATLE